MLSSVKSTVVICSFSDDLGNLSMLLLLVDTVGTVTGGELDVVARFSRFDHQPVILDLDWNKEGIRNNIYFTALTHNIYNV